MNNYEHRSSSFRCPLQDGEQAATFLAWMDGTLSLEETAVLELHARECASCQAVLDGQRAIWSAMDTWTPGSISPDFNRRLYAVIDAEQAQPWWKRAFSTLLPFPVKPAAPIAASCLLLIGVVLFRVPDPVEIETKQAGIVERVGERVDVEQVDRSLDDLNLLRELSEELKLETSAKSL